MTTAQSVHYSATNRMVQLMAALPAPTGEGQDLWHELWRESDSAYLMPANLKHLVLRAMEGDDYGLAGQFISAIEEMTGVQRTAAADVIGRGIAEATFLTGYKPGTIGRLWLRDFELTAWRVLHSGSQRDDLSRRDALRDDWRSC